jgi:thiol-disulfide isomerase/thioredoxin
MAYTILLALLPLISSGISAAGLDSTIPNARTMLLRSPAIMDYLVLNDGQRRRLGAVLDWIDYPIWKLRNHPPALRDTRVQSLLAELDMALGRILTYEQRHAYQTLVPVARGQRSLAGNSINWAQVPQRACRAPELEGVSAWINSPAFTLASQKGRVVVLHFLAIDCGNCVANLPHYNQWYTRYDANEVKILGIHRPETTRERSVDRVRAKLASHAVTHPIAIDNDSRNWDAWANQVWPSVYLIDKAGFVRYWWYGELEFQGRGGEQWASARIKELLQE